MKLLAFIILVLAASAASAQSKKTEAEAAYKEGQARYMKEDFEGAALQFKAAYDLDADPVYLFNIAQAYRMAKKCSLSRDNYQRYLDEAKTAPNADAVKAYITEMDQCAKQQGEVVTPPPETKDPEPIVVAPPVEETPSGGGSTRTIGIVVGIVGVVALANGAYFAKRVGDAESEANGIKTRESCENWTMDCDDDWNDVNSRGKRDEKIMIGSLIGGGAAVATGVVLFVLGGSKSQEAPVAVTPIRGGAAVSFSF